MLVSEGRFIMSPNEYIIISFVITLGSGLMVAILTYKFIRSEQYREVAKAYLLLVVIVFILVLIAREPIASVLSLVKPLPTEAFPSPPLGGVTIPAPGPQFVRPLSPGAGVSPLSSTPTITVLPDILAQLASSTSVPIPTSISPTPIPQYGDQIVYCARIGSDNDSQIILQDLQSGERWVLATATNPDPAPTWSPDGNKLVFVSEVGNYSQLHLLDWTTRTHSVLTTTSYDKGQPSWSPDGRYIAYAVMQQNRDMDLYILELSQMTEWQLTNYPGIVEIWGPKWSPDGKYIAFWSNVDYPGKQHFEVYLLAFPPKALEETDSTSLYHWSSEVPSRPDDDEQFVWSPNGQWFAFINKPDDADKRYFDILFGEFDVVRELGRWPAKKETIERIPDPNRVFEAAPAWSPDSTRIAFHRVTAGYSYNDNKDILIFDLRTADLANVTLTPDVDERWPAWRPRQ
jgi:Tol biopolymer transport system component